MEIAECRNRRGADHQKKERASRQELGRINLYAGAYAKAHPSRGGATGSFPETLRSKNTPLVSNGKYN